MATFEWTGLGLADNVVLDNTNLNAVGNGTGTLVYQALSGGATRVTQQSADGNGVTIAGGAGSLGRNDTQAVTGGAECMAVDFTYKAPATPTVDANFLIVGRNANATPASTGHVGHTITTNRIEFRNSSNTLVSGGNSPALVAGDFYRISFAIIRNTLVAPTTSNGRIIGRVRSTTAPGTWNAGAEFYIDTGYTVNVTLDKTNLFRTGKAATAGAVAAFDFLNLKWRDLATPETSTTKALAITNFVQDAAATIDTAGTGAHYVIRNIGTPVVGGALTYSIAQTAGTTHAATIINPDAPTVPRGVWYVDQDAVSATTYDVTVSEAGGGTIVTTHVVPSSVTTTTGQYREWLMVGGVLV